MRIVDSFELVIVPHTLSISMQFQDPDIGDKGTAVTTTLDIPGTIPAPTIIATKRAIFGVATIDIPAAIPVPDVYGATFASPAPFSLSLTIIGPTIITTTVAAPSEVALPGVIPAPTTNSVVNFNNPGSYGAFFETWNDEQSAYIISSAGYSSTPNAGIPGEDVSIWVGQASSPSETHVFSTSLFGSVSNPPSLKTKTITNQNGAKTQRYIQFDQTGAAANSHIGLLGNWKEHLGSYMNNRSAIAQVWVVEPVYRPADAIGTLLEIRRAGGGNNHLTFYLLYGASTSFVSVYCEAYRTGSDGALFYLGNITIDQLSIIVFSVDFSGRRFKGYVNNVLVLDSTPIFSAGSNTDPVDCSEFTLGGSYSSGSMSKTFAGNLYRTVLYTGLITDVDVNTINMKLGGLYGINITNRYP